MVMLNMNLRIQEMESLQCCQNWESDLIVRKSKVFTELLSSWEYDPSTPITTLYGYDGTDLNVAKATPNYLTYGALYNWAAAKMPVLPAGIYPIKRMDPIS